MFQETVKWRMQRNNMRDIPARIVLSLDDLGRLFEIYIAFPADSYVGNKSPILARSSGLVTPSPGEAGIVISSAPG